MFVDRAKVYIKAGSGGKGCESFYAKKGFRFRRRDGGDGGKGGDVIIKADGNIYTLLDFRYRQHFKAESGKHGSSNLKKGKEGKDCLILVPPGTIIRDINQGLLIRDLNSEDERVVVAKGGNGGIGNYKKKTHATDGQLGQEKIILLELKLIADVGLIGYPNAGKSSFINIASSAKSKVASFPFTTLSPVLGVVKSPLADNRLVIADIPGLIENAHAGKGLGTEFLRHIERTKVLLFLVDMAGADGRAPWQDYSNLLKEIRLYKRELLKKPQVLVANKMDLAAAEKNLEIFRQKIKKKVFLTSCKTRFGIEELINVLFKKLSSAHKKDEK